MTKNMRYFVLLLFVFSTSFLVAQAPQVQSIDPVNQAILADPAGAISITFDQAIDPATMTFGNFRVFGRWSGPAEVSFSLSSDQRTVEMTPFESFMAGEWVAVMVTKNVTAIDGTPMAQGYVWNFWTAVNDYISEPVINLIKTIELRETGEGLLQAYGAYAGDLNNDGFSDLTVINETSDDIRILLNDGTGDYTDFETIPLNSGTPSPNEGADFNNDGEIDLAICTAHDNQLRILYGDGSGTLGDMQDLTTGLNARGLGVIELDGDGDDDLVIANRGSSNLSLYFNDGFGVFTTTNIDPPGEGESGLVVVDMNNDGIQDLVLGMYTSSEVIVLLGDGTGGFFNGTPVAVQGQPWMLAVGDFNGDGSADVASANSTGNNVAILLNDGSGGLAAPSYLSEFNALFPLAIDVGDLDGDKDLDIVTSNYTSSTFQIYYNDGSGNFATGPSLEAGLHASCAILHDRDNDGDLDISGTDEGDDWVLLYDLSPIILATSELETAYTKIQPNPFVEEVSILMGEVNRDVKLQIFDLHGQLVQELPVSEIVRWNGKSMSGIEVPVGVYYLTWTDGEKQSVQKIIKAQ
jgi:hypothetical protein